MISILVATCFRPKLLEDMIRTLNATRGDHDVEVVFVVDQDFETVETITKWTHGNYILDFSPERRGALRCWNRGLELSTGDILVPAGDDQIFHPGWLDYALSSHKEQLSGYGVVGMNDLAYDGNKQVATMFMFDKEWCIDNMGGMFAPPVYKYYCVDLEWNEKAKMLGNFYWDDRAIVEHVHSAHGKRPVDFLDQEKVDNNFAEVDNAVFKKRKAENFPIEWDSVI